MCICRPFVHKVDTLFKIVYRDIEWLQTALIIHNVDAQIFVTFYDWSCGSDPHS